MALKPLYEGSSEGWEFTNVGPLSRTLRGNMNGNPAETTRLTDCFDRRSNDSSFDFRSTRIAGVPVDLQWLWTHEFGGVRIDTTSAYRWTAFRASNRLPAKHAVTLSVAIA